MIRFSILTPLLFLFCISCQKEIQNEQSYFFETKDGVEISEFAGPESTNNKKVPCCDAVIPFDRAPSQRNGRLSLPLLFLMYDNPSGNDKFDIELRIIHSNNVVGSRTLRNVNNRHSCERYTGGIYTLNVSLFNFTWDPNKTYYFEATVYRNGHASSCNYSNRRVIVDLGGGIHNPPNQRTE